ncbi:MAG: ABC transporter ATP-binding protein [Gammaproteobacteria bacterium]|nr:ABC transporter ATP-binding protein [Gammaproteobacteria bacterium]
MNSALTIRNLRKTYKNGFQAIKGIDLEVQKGDFFALLGPNGAGKSTIIGIISSLIRKSGGEVFIFGLDIDQHFTQAKQYIGVVPQEFNFNVFEPVIEILVNQAGYFGIDRRRAFDIAEDILHRLGLWKKRRGMARELSGGMKRRLLIARALVHQPRLLILDEPTAGVDIEIRRTMWEFLQMINAEGTTIILTTHYLEEAENLCRNIAIIDDGGLIENTSMRHLLDQLHREIFIFYLKYPVAPLPELAGYEVRRIDDKTVEVVLPQEHNLNDLFGVFSQYGLQIASMKNKTNRLEETFLRLVSKNAKQENNAGPLNRL